MTAALAGDAAAVELVLECLACIPRILAALNRRSSPRFRAEDLADLRQEVLVLVWRKLPEFRGEAALESWAYPFCAHLMRNAARRRRPRPLSSRSGAWIEPATDGREGDREHFEHLQAALRKLSRQQETCIRMRWFQAASFEAIATALAVPVCTAKTRYYRGMERLRALLTRLEA